MNVLVGVSGGIAAYKAAEIVSKVVGAGGNVRVAMTRSATQFIGPLTFEALTNHPVLIDALTSGVGDPDNGAVEHVAWAKWATFAVLAPMTANTMAKLALGLADDAVSTVWLALPATVPSVLCPAMNTHMWENPITQRNKRWLEDSGRHRIVAPVEKRLACGDVGVGALADTADILRAIGLVEASAGVWQAPA